MSESTSETDESAEEGAESQSASDESVQETGSGNGSSLEDFISEAEQEVIKDWLVYVTGLFAALGVAIGLNVNVQDQWGHFLISTSQAGQTIGVGFQTFNGVGMFMTIGVVGVTLLGTVFARNVDNENQTAYKVAAAAAIVGIPVISLIGGILSTQPGNFSLEFVNVIVSAIGSAVSAVVGAAIVIYLTEEQAPDALSP